MNVKPVAKGAQGTDIAGDAKFQPLIYSVTLDRLLLPVLYARTHFCKFNNVTVGTTKSVPLTIFATIFESHVNIAQLLNKSRQISHKTLLGESEKGCVTIYLKCYVHFCGHYICIHTIAIVSHRRFS
jgi:hypothetical protein